jgi:DNA-directed RNA polymerase specialized sigma24 family protein
VREEKSADDAAKQLGITIKSVYNAKHRILKRIRELRADFDNQVA